MTECACSFIKKKKTLKKAKFLQKEETKYCLLLLYGIIMQTNKLFIFRDLLKFTMKCIGGQIKAFSFLFSTASDVKSTKGGEP